MMTHTFTRTVLLLLLAAALSACSPGQKQGKQAPEPVVSVVTANPKTLAVETVLTGRLEASRKAEVRARVPGVLLKRLFTEGSLVKAGQPLFLIDDAPYRAAQMTAQATFTKAQADRTRMRPLMEAGAISKQEWDAVVQGYQVAKANLETANINLGYAHVRAPISGRIGRAEVTEGALVGQGTPTLLATIQQNNPMYINMSQSADEVMKMRAALASGSLKSAEEVPVHITFEDGGSYPLTGKLLFTDPTVDEATGQVSLRAEMPNPDGVLFPGLFVKVHVAQTEIPDAVAIPQQAVTRGNQGDIVMVMNADGTFGPRPIKIAAQQDNQWIVTGGLKAGEKVIVDGLMTAQMMQAKKVKTQEWGQAAPAAAPAAAAPEAEHAASAAAPAASDTAASAAH